MGGSDVDNRARRAVRWSIDPTPEAVPPWRIAFGDAPAAPIIVRPSDGPEWCWAAAVALGARGRYAAAAARLESLFRDPAVPRRVRAHAAITRGAHLRQLGGHVQARRWDGLGLALATGGAGAGAGAVPVDPGGEVPVDTGDDASEGDGSFGVDSVGADLAAARVDGLLGLAADALGTADLELGARLLADVRPRALAHPSWRPRVRWHWVRAELALASGQPGPAVEHAEQAVGLARRAGAVRHELKSELVLVVARSCAGEPASSTYHTLEGLVDRTSVARLGSLEWPLLLLLVKTAGAPESGGPAGHQVRLIESLARIRRSADPFGRRVASRSPWVSDVSGA